MDPAGHRLSGEQQQQQPVERAKADADRDTADMLPPLRTETSPFEQAGASAKRNSAASAPLSAAVKAIPTLAAAMSSLRAGDDTGGEENEGEEEPFLTNGSIALAEFTSLLKPAENTSILKEHIIHLLRDVDAEETLMRIARALEAQGTSETPVNVSATTCTGSSRDVASYTNASQSTATSMSMVARRRSSVMSRRDATSLETLAGLSFLHSQRGATSPSAQESPSSAQPSEDVAPYNRSTRGLGGPMDVSFNSHSSLGTREEEPRQSKQDDPLSTFMAASASQLSDVTPTLREPPGLPTGGQCQGRRVAVSAAPCMPPPEIIGGDSPATALPPLRVLPKTPAEEQQLRRLLRRCHSFTSLEADTLEGVLKAMDKEVHAAGTAILEQGQATTEKLYLVGEGTCEAIKNGKSLGPLQPGGTFGELELMYKQAVCAATVRCVTRCVLYTLDEASYHRVVMTSVLQKRRKFEKLTMNVPFLRCLPDFERMKIAEALETRVYQCGKTIIRFGSPGNYMHFIIEGEVKVVGRNSGRRVEVVRLRDGDVVGELEFLFNHLTVADVVATSREVRTACISREHFELIIGPIQDRLKEFVATSSTYEKYYVAEVADESVRTELSRIESSRKHRRVASRDQRTAIGDIDLHGEVLLSAPLSLLHGKCDTAGDAGGVGGAASSDSVAGDGADAHGQRTTAARGSAKLPKALLRFPFAPITGKDVAVLALREDGLIMYWNSVLERLTSYSVGEAVGQNIYSFLLSEREQQCMYKAVNAARNYAGEAEAFLKRPSTKPIQFTLARSDGLTKATLRLTIAPPVVSAGGNAAEVVLGFGEEVREGPQKMLEQPQWLSGQIRAILADGTQTFEERLECIAETLNNFESTYRAMTVSTERLRVVNIRQMMGHILMDFGGECVSRGISVRQRFEGLPSERAYLDAHLLPECLRYAMKLCLKYSDPGGSIITIMITVTEKNGLEFLVVNFNLTGDGIPKAIAKFFGSPLSRHGDSVTTMSVDEDSGDDSGDDSDNDAEASMALRSSLRPRLRRKLRRVQRAVEDQGGTLRMLCNPQDSNIAFLIPFMPASEQDAENASIEESLSTLADSTGAGQLTSLAGMGSGVGPPISVPAAAAAESVSLTNTPGGESSGLSNFSAAGAVAAVPGQPNFSYTTCLAEDTPAHRIMLSSFLWERHHAVLTAFTFEDIVGLVGVADILIIDLQQSAITFLHERDPITRLREMLRHMAVIITSTSFDLVSSDTYAAAGFITLKKPCTPVQAMKAIRRAEERSAVVKLERLRIEQTRETLARNSRGAWRHGALLGKGSSGEVYEAYDVLTGGKMAVKEMRLGNNDAKIEQFVQEISTMCNLQHPNIIHYFYCEESKEQKVIRVFMEYAGGGTLQSLLKTKGRLEYVELRALLRDVVEGLAYIHSQHYVHGDIKTANVLLSNDGKGKIGDFGTARTVNEGELLYVMQGSPLYMSPECMSAGEEDEDGNKIGYSFPSDIWSLGCVAMEMATNKPPFAHIKAIKGPAGLTNFVTSLTDVPDLSPLFKCHPSVVEFVSACLNPDPSQRATAQDLLQMSLFSESTHSDRNSAVMALKRAQLLHVLNKFVAFQEPEEAEKLEKQRNCLKVSRLASDFFSSSSSSSDNAGEPMPTVLNSASAAEVDEAASEKRRRGAAVTTTAATTAAVATGDEDEDDKGVTRRSDTVARAAGGASESLDGTRPAGASAGAPLVNTVTSTDGSLHQAASTFTRYLRKWDSSSTSSSSLSSELNEKSKAMTAAGGEGAHRDPVTGVAGANDEAEPDARNPQTEDVYDHSPTPKKRSKTRSRPQATPAPPTRKPSHQLGGPGSTTTTTNSAEKDFFATSSDDSSSSSSGRALNKADVRSEALTHQGGTAQRTGTPTTACKVPRPTGSEAVGYIPSFPGRRRNVRLDEAGNIVPFDRLSSMMSVATLVNIKGEQHGDDASAEGVPGVAPGASQVPFSTLGNANDHVLSPGSAVGLANASFAQPTGNYSFFSFNRNISFMGANMDEVLNSAANDFLSNLAANWHTSNTACVETASSAGSTVQQLPSRVFQHAERSCSGRSHATLSSNREGECRTDCVVGVASPLAVTGQSKDRGDVPETPSRRRGGAMSRSPSARSPLETRGPGEPASIEGGNGGVQHGGTMLPLPQSPLPKPLSTAAAPTAASRFTQPVLSQLCSASYTSDDGTTSMTPRADSVPLVGAAASSNRRRRARPPITNHSFFVVEDRSSAPLFSPCTGSTKLAGSMAGGPVSASRVSLATWSSVASADGSVTGGMAGETSSSPLLQQNYANVAVVAPPPVFPTFSTSNARAVWQQRRRHVAGGGRSGMGSGNISNIHLTAPLSNEGSVYLVVADEHQRDGQQRGAADTAVGREGNDDDDDDDNLTSAAFCSMHSGFSRRSSAQGTPYLTAEALSATHAQGLKWRPARSSGAGAFGSEDRRGAEARDAPPLNNLTSEADSPVFTHLQRIDASLQDLLSQVRRRQQQQQQHQCWRKSCGSITGVQDSFDHAPSSTSITTVQATPPQSATQLTTLHSSLSSALPSPASASSTSEVATTVTVVPRHRRSTGVNTSPAKLPRPLSSCTTSVTVSQSRQAMANPLSMQASPPLSKQCSNPRWPTEDDAEVEGDPVQHDATVSFGTPLSPSSSGRCASSGCDDVNIEALLRKMLWRRSRPRPADSLARSLFPANKSHEHEYRLCRTVAKVMSTHNSGGNETSTRACIFSVPSSSYMHHAAGNAAITGVAAACESVNRLEASEATRTAVHFPDISATLTPDGSNSVARAVGSGTNQDTPNPPVAVPPQPSSRSQNSLPSSFRTSAPLSTTPLPTFIVGGSAACQYQSIAVADSIVRSSSALFSHDQAVALLSGKRDMSTSPPSRHIGGDSSRSATPLTASTTASLDLRGENTPIQQNALEVLQRAVNHVRSNLHQGSVVKQSVDSGTEDERTGHSIAQAVRAVVRAAEMIDQENMDSSLNDSDVDDAPSEATTGTRRSHRAMDWRDDDNSIVSPSTFFHSDASLQVRSNRVMECIVAKGHAAQTEEELTWLYRHALLTSLLDTEDLQRIVPLSLHREYTRGELILDFGAPVQHLYVVVWGSVDVFRIDSVNNEQKAMEGAFRVASHQSVSMKLRSMSGTRDRHGSLSSYGLRLSDAQDASTNSEIPSDAVHTHVASLYPGQVFGIENCVFNTTSQYVFRAGSAMSKTVVSLLPYEELQPVLSRNPRFAQGVGVCITGSMDVFGPIRQFCRYVFSPTSAQNEYLPLWSILESYTRIHNVIHTKLFSHEVDTGAWGYALNRLPENLTSTFCFDLVHALPPFIASRMKVEARAADTRKTADGLARARSMRTAITYIRTKERRRCTWHLGMEGKTLVLLRDGFTDLLDFLTMLCVHIIESNKLRGRMQGMVHPPAIDVLDEYLRQREQEELEGKYLAADGVTRDAEMQRVQAILKRMPLTEGEQAGLLRNWGHNTLLRLYEIMMHREEYNVRVDPSLSLKFQTNPFHEWALNLRGCVLEKLGLDRFSALPDNLCIDVISSNTHCIKNLLCSFNRKYRDEILDYVRLSESKRLGRPEEWHNTDDMLYAALTGFLQNERPDLKEEYNRSLEQSGITVLQDTAMTGLQVDVIPVHLLNFDTIDEAIREAMHMYYMEATERNNGEGESRASSSQVLTWSQVCKPIWRRSSEGPSIRVPGCMMASGRKSIPAGEPTPTDSHGPASASESLSTPSGTSVGHHCRNGRLQQHFLINMDFAFGAQAEGICRVIFSAFGKRIRSVSVMGKAGGLTGKRGDIQLASHVLLSKSSLILEDNQDELRNCRNQDLTAQRLQELAGPRVKVHHGKVLTVTGTMLQNVSLLRYYQQVWRCIGTEMEGSYFARVIEDFYRQGIAHPGLTTRFAYYTSDLPLAQNDAEMEARRTHRLPAGGATLSAPMSPQEGVPPLYAIARGILENVLL